MAIKIPKRNYLTFGELQKRWECDENDLRYAIVSGELKACIRVTEELPQPEWKTHYADGRIPIGPDESDDGSKPYDWSYLQCPIQTGAFDCRFNVISDDRDPVIPLKGNIAAFTMWWWLPTTMTLDEVVREGVFLATEVALFESKHGENAVVPSKDKSAGTKERETLLKLVIGMAVKGYNYDPTATKNNAPKEIADDLAALDMSVSDDTVRKYLKQAADTVLPGKARQS